MSKDGVIVIEAAEYEESRQRLMKDPIVIAMAHGLADVPREDIAHDDGSPRWEFTMSANKEYRERGGKDGYAIGTVPDALIRLLDSGVVKPTKVVTYHASRDSLTAWRDEDRAMAHASIKIEDPSSFKSAKQGLVDYMVKEAGYLLEGYGSHGPSDALVQRAHKILELVAEVYQAKFPELDGWEALSYDTAEDGIRYQLVRVSKEVK